MTLTLTYDLDIQSSASYDHDHTLKFKVNGQSVPKIEWKQTDGRTDVRSDCITSYANAVGNNVSISKMFIQLTSINVDRINLQHIIYITEKANLIL